VRGGPSKQQEAQVVGLPAALSTWDYSAWHYNHPIIVLDTITGAWQDNRAIMAYNQVPFV